jgi:hypothetical protein
MMAGNVSHGMISRYARPGIASTGLTATARTQIVITA